MNQFFLDRPISLKMKAAAYINSVIAEYLTAQLKLPEVTAPSTVPSAAASPPKPPRRRRQSEARGEVPNSDICDSSQPAAKRSMQPSIFFVSSFKAVSLFIYRFAYACPFFKPL
jgi:hypothetical protein